MTTEQHTYSTHLSPSQLIERQRRADEDYRKAIECFADFQPGSLFRCHKPDVHFFRNRGPDTLTDPFNHKDYHVPGLDTLLLYLGIESVVNRCERNQLAPWMRSSGQFNMIEMYHHEVRLLFLLGGEVWHLTFLSSNLSNIRKEFHQVKNILALEKYPTNHG